MNTCCYQCIAEANDDMVGAMRLIEAWLGEPERTYELFGKFAADENGFENPAAGMDKADFAAYVRGLKDEANGVGLRLVGCRPRSTSW